MYVLLMALAFEQDIVETGQTRSDAEHSGFTCHRNPIERLIIFVRPLAERIGRRHPQLNISRILQRLLSNRQLVVR